MENCKEINRKHFNESAEKFSHDHSKDHFTMQKEGYNIVHEEVKKESFRSFLDLGCGFGNSIELVLKDFPNTRCAGLDIAEKMINVAKDKQLPHTEFLVGDAENLPFDEKDSHQRFDTVICKETLHHFPNPEKVFSEVYRVLNPNGRFIIYDFASTIDVTQWVKHKSSISSHGVCHHKNISEYFKKYNFKILREENVLEERMIITGKKIVQE